MQETSEIYNKNWNQTWWGKITQLSRVLRKTGFDDIDCVVSFPLVAWNASQ